MGLELGGGVSPHQKNNSQDCSCQYYSLTQSWHYYIEWDHKGEVLMPWNRGRRKIPLLPGKDSENENHGLCSLSTPSLLWCWCCWWLITQAQLCLTLLQPHGISQARILEWVVISSFRGSSQPRDGTSVFCIGNWVLYCWAAGLPRTCFPPPCKYSHSLSLRELANFYSLLI